MSDFYDLMDEKILEHLNKNSESNSSDPNHELLMSLIQFLKSKNINDEVIEIIKNQICGDKKWININKDDIINIPKILKSFELNYKEFETLIKGNIKKQEERIKSEAFLIVKREVFHDLVMKKSNDATERVCNYILKNNNIYTTRNDEREEVWLYVKGIYLSQGKTYIKEMCRKIFEAALTTQLCNKVILKIQTETYIDQDKFFENHSLNMVPVMNGLFDLFTKELKPFNPELIFFNKLPVYYYQKADCPKIKEFFNEVLVGDIDRKFIQELFGFCLYRDYKFEQSFMFHGTGRNGKSKTIELLKKMLGAKNCANVPLSRLEKTDFALYELHNKMVNLAADISSTVLTDTSDFKQLTGHDEITANRKFLNSVSFVNHAKMIFSANELPETRDTKDGFFDRWEIIDFVYRFLPQKVIDELTPEEKINVKLQDPEKINKITSQEELNGLFNWAVEGFQRLWKNKCFSKSSTASEIKIKWLRRSSSIQAFIMDHIEMSEDTHIIKSEFRSEYTKYCRKHRVVPVSDKRIAYALTTEMGASEMRISIEGSQRFVWYGIKFVDKIPTSQDRQGFSNPIEITNLPRVSDTIASNTNNIHIDSTTIGKGRLHISTRNQGLKDNEQLIKENERIESAKPVPSEVKVEDIISYLKAHDNEDGIDTQDLIKQTGCTDEQITKLLQSGDIFPPRSGRVKLLN